MGPPPYGVLVVRLEAAGDDGRMLSRILVSLNGGELRLRGPLLVSGAELTEALAGIVRTISYELRTRSGDGSVT